MSLARAVRGAVLAQSPDQIGFCAIVVFLLLTAFRDIYLWSIFQEFSPLHVATLSFGLSAVFFLPATLIRHRDQLRPFWAWPGETLLMTAACAVSWITYFYALRNLEPALAQMLCAGVGPITADLVGRRRGSAGDTSNTELVMHLGIVASLLLAVLVQVGGPSPLTSRPLVAFIGDVGVALVSGITLALYRITCKRLNERGAGAGAILAVRSPIIAVAAAVVASMTHDTDVSMWSAATVASVSIACIVLIVVPIYVNQVGVALASPITAGVATALQPTLLFAMQVMVRGREMYSASSLASILVYSAFAILSTIVRRRASSVPHARAPRTRPVGI